MVGRGMCSFSAGCGMSLVRVPVRPSSLLGELRQLVQQMLTVLSEHVPSRATH
jgi:hypothetical protein